MVPLIPETGLYGGKRGRSSQLMENKNIVQTNVLFPYQKVIINNTFFVATDITLITMNF
jgi:hypothetical protein